MKLDKISNPILDLSDAPSISIIKNLRVGDLIVDEGTEYLVQVVPKKLQKGQYVIGICTKDKKKSQYLKIRDNVKPQMTAHEKSVMLKNIRKNVDKFHGVDDKKLLEMIPAYYHNLAVLNGYDESDVRECMSEFPQDLLLESGVPV